jgi:hypothetical protein
LRQRPAGIFGLSIALAAFSFCQAGQVCGQSPSAPAATSTGPQAVTILVKRFAVNGLASDPNTHRPLRANGSWSISKNRPASCPQTSTNCVEVFYAVSDQSVKCSWVLSLDDSGTGGTVLEENDDAATYMLRVLNDQEAVPLIKSRAKPVDPPIAVAAHVSGNVITKVLVGKTGEVEHVWVLSGPPMLQGASINAAQKWSFLPLTIGARAVEYEVQITFGFYPSNPPMPGAVKMTP